jgi:integrase
MSDGIDTTTVSTTAASVRSGSGSSMRMTREQLVELQKAIANKRAAQPANPDGIKCWHPDKSLHLCLRQYGPASGKWFTTYDTPRRRGRSWKIGDAALINTTAAEKAAKQVQARVQLGEDPQEERRELRDRPRLTVRALCREFFDEVHKDPKFSRKTEKGYRNIEKNHLGPLGDLMFDELVGRQNEIVIHVRKLNAKSAHLASAFRTMLGSTYKWAMTVYPDNIPRNPVTGTWVPDYRPQKVGQALSMEQLGAIWRACEIMEREAVPTYRGNGLGGGLSESVQAKTAYVSTTEAAKIANMHHKSLLNRMRAGEIRAIRRTPKKGSKIKRPHYLFAAEDLKQFTDARLLTMRSVDLEYSVIVRLMILFGSRYGEMGMLRWSEIDLDKGILHMPTVMHDDTGAKPHRRLKSNAGRDKDLTIYMPQLAIDLIKKIPRRLDRDFLFGIGPRGLTENDLQKRALDAIILRSEGALAKGWVRGPDEEKTNDHWTLHWLRHSFSTRADEDLSIDLRVIRAITNHLSREQKQRMWGGENEPGQHSRYTHSKYEKFQRRDLERWAQYVLDTAHCVERKSADVVSFPG